MRKTYLLFLVLTAIISAHQVSYGQPIPPKREFRGAWVATVSNIDFPSAQGLSKERFMSEWVETVTLLEESGFNAVVAQVRPSGDAFYRSKISPWSKYLSGKQGMGPADDFDPLQFMVDEAHKRNLEFHAWLNPYRASMDTTTTSLSEMHPYKHHPEWFFSYGGKLYFNPALPDVRNYITEIVTEIVIDYDVDGIHFDDYYYPYPAAGELLPDAADFAKYGFGFVSIEDWRRHNVDMLIGQISTMIRLTGPKVKFGVSPFGVWRNSTKDPKLGSATRSGVNTYDDLYADVRGWLEKGWVDYVAPQIYWHIGFPVADYEVLLKWWTANAFGRNVYTGQAMYKLGTNQEPAWQNSLEIPKQIRLNRSTAGIQGSLFYNFSSLRKNPYGVTDSLRLTYFRTPALLPELPYMKLEQSPTPTITKPRLVRKAGLKFKCQVNDPKHDATSMIVYRFEDRRPGDYNNPENIFKIIRLNGAESVEVMDETAQKGKIYTYVASTMNAQHTESLLSSWRAVKLGKWRIKKVR